MILTFFTSNPFLVVWVMILFGFALIITTIILYIIAHRVCRLEEKEAARLQKEE